MMMMAEDLLPTPPGAACMVIEKNRTRVPSGASIEPISGELLGSSSSY